MLAKEIVGGSHSPHASKQQQKMVILLEFPLWHNGIGGVLGVLRHRFHLRLAQWVKDPTWPQLWLRWQQWLRSDSLTQKLHMPSGQPKKEKKKKGKFAGQLLRLKKTHQSKQHDSNSVTPIESSPVVQWVKVQHCY